MVPVIVLVAVLASSPSVSSASPRTAASEPRTPRPVAAHVLTGLAVFRGAVTSAFAVSGYVLRIDERWQEAQERFEDDPWFSFDILPGGDVIER